VPTQMLVSGGVDKGPIILMHLWYRKMYLSIIGEWLMGCVWGKGGLLGKFFDYKSYPLTHHFIITPINFTTRSIVVAAFVVARSDTNYIIVLYCSILTSREEQWMIRVVADVAMAVEGRNRLEIVGCCKILKFIFFRHRSEFRYDRWVTCAHKNSTANECAQCRVYNNKTVIAGFLLFFRKNRMIFYSPDVSMPSLSWCMRVRGTPTIGIIFVMNIQ